MKINGKRPPAPPAARRPRKPEAEPVSVRLAKAENRRARGRSRNQARLHRMRDRFDRWRNAQLRQMEHDGQIRYVSFKLWMLEQGCGWRESDMRPDAFTDVWRWWLGLHPMQQLGLVRSQRWFARQGRGTIACG